MHNYQQIAAIRKWMIFFITALVISGVTAFAVESELEWLLTFFDRKDTDLYRWLHRCYIAIASTNQQYSFLAYGFDWLAFSHIVIAVFFIGVYQDPVRNIWITKAGLIACTLVIPVAIIAGYVRHIPAFWIMIDCSFGIIGLVPLLICYQKSKILEKENERFILTKRNKLAL